MNASNLIISMQRLMIRVSLKETIEFWNLNTFSNFPTNLIKKVLKNAKCHVNREKKSKKK